MEFTKKQVEEALNAMVKSGHLKKTSKGYIDSDRVTALLSEGKSREQIDDILRKEFEMNKLLDEEG